MSNQYLNIIGIKNATKDPFDQNDNKLITHGRVLQEIDNAITNNAFNYIIDDIQEITYTSPATPTRPTATALSPDILFVHVVDLKAENPNQPYYELLQKIKTSDTPTYEYRCKQIPLSSIIFDSRKGFNHIYTLISKEEVPSSETVPYPYQTWDISNNAFNYVVNSISSMPNDPSDVGETADNLIFVYVSSGNYYELLIKVYDDSTSKYKYVCNRVLPSSIVLVKSSEDIFTLYSTSYPTSSETVPGNYQYWVKTDRFNEDIQINLTNTPISLTTKGDIQIDDTHKLTIMDLDITPTPDPLTNYSELTLTDLDIKKTTIDPNDSNITTTNTIEITSNYDSSSVPPLNSAVISVTYNYDDITSGSEEHICDSVCISGHNQLDSSNTGASVVLVGDNSFVETPILRLRIIPDE